MRKTNDSMTCEKRGGQWLLSSFAVSRYTYFITHTNAVILILYLTKKIKTSDKLKSLIFQNWWTMPWDWTKPLLAEHSMFTVVGGGILYKNGITYRSLTRFHINFEGLCCSIKSLCVGMFGLNCMATSAMLTNHNNDYINNLYLSYWILTSPFMDCNDGENY